MCTVTQSLMRKVLLYAFFEVAIGAYSLPVLDVSCIFPHHQAKETYRETVTKTQVRE